jgi:hypothetical protein
MDINATFINTVAYNFGILYLFEKKKKSNKSKN